MISLRQRMFWAGLLASASFAAAAQTAPVAPPPPAAEAQPGAEQTQRMRRGDPAQFMQRMQQRRARHLAELKDKLKLNPAQEGAWSSFTAATQPPARTPQRMDRAEFDKLSTPQRLDRMQARQAERSAMFARRADATRSFYAALTPEQQKTFDAESMRHMAHGGPGMNHGHGHHGHDGQRPPPTPRG